tara:strand:- start:111 stop:335 length:225 start_codon:yes stop_codon:yes gene_type:complete
MADTILNTSDNGPFGGMTDDELELLLVELMREPEYRRKQLAALLIHSTLNITENYIDEIGTSLRNLSKMEQDDG